jgi:hypothetical protein
MADFVFNIAKGRVVEYYNRVKSNDPSPSALVIAVVLATSGLESDATLKDKDDLAALVSGATNEATNTGYARKTLTDSDLARCRRPTMSTIATTSTSRSDLDRGLGRRRLVEARHLLRRQHRRAAPMPTSSRFALTTSSSHPRAATSSLRLIRAASSARRDPCRRQLFNRGLQVQAAATPSPSVQRQLTAIGLLQS